MRLHILSDLHLEFAPWEPPATAADVVVMAGDVHPGKQGIRWLLQHFPHQPVLYVCGNHEFYGQKLPKLTRELKALAQGTQVHVLENEGLELGGVRFLGTTLWTDFALHGDRAQAESAAATGMNDFRRIRTEPTYRKFRPVDARLLHLQSLAWLKAQTQAAVGRKTVVITHHAPSPQSLAGAAADDPLSPCYASNLEPYLAECGAALWIHGHFHRRSDYCVGATRLVANPRGYPDQRGTGFDPALTIEL
jgi:hypothetical protein